MPKGEFKSHSETQKPNNEDITQLGREITSTVLLAGLPYTIDITQEPTMSFEPRYSPQTPALATIHKLGEKYDHV